MEAHELNRTSNLYDCVDCFIPNPDFMLQYAGATLEDIVELNCSGDENDSQDGEEEDEDELECHTDDETEMAATHSQTIEAIKPNSMVASDVTANANLFIMESNDNIIAMQTFIRNSATLREEFVFHADRLIRLVIEASLNHLPHTEKTITTPTESEYDGVEFLKANCGVSIVPSGDAMENDLRQCCLSIRIGKILITRNPESGRARVVYARFPPDIDRRKVLLLYPIMCTGSMVSCAIRHLFKVGVKQENIILVNLFSTPLALQRLFARFENITVQTSEVHPIVPSHFAHKYFNSDNCQFTVF